MGKRRFPALIIMLVGLCLLLIAGAQAEEYPTNPYRNSAEQTHREEYRRLRGAGDFSLEVREAPSFDAEGSGRIIKNVPNDSYTFRLQIIDEDLDADLRLLYSHEITADSFTLPRMTLPARYRLALYCDYGTGKTWYYCDEYHFVLEADADHPALAQVVSGVVDECRVAGDDWETALRLHDWLTHHAYYDSTYCFYGPEGVLVRGTGVCDSYSKAYLLLLSEAGIPVERVIASGMNHAWNRVCFDGHWTQTDVTWDDPISDATAVSGSEKHYFFAVSDAFFMDPKYGHRVHHSYDLNHPCNTMAYSALIRLKEEQERWPLLDCWMTDNMATKGTYTALIQAELDLQKSSFDIPVYRYVPITGSTSYYDTLSANYTAYWNGKFHIYALAKSMDLWQDAAGNRLLVTITFDSDNRVLHVESNANPQNLEGAEISLLTQEDIIYTGDPIEPGLVVILDGTALTEDEYTVVYRNNVHAGTALATITGAGSVYGTVDFSFEILPKDINTVTAAEVRFETVYSQSSHTDCITSEIWTDENGRELGADCFTVQIERDFDAMTETRTYEGKGDYQGNLVRENQVSGWDLAGNIWCSFWDDTSDFTGKAIVPDIYVAYPTQQGLNGGSYSGGHSHLYEGRDYSVTCRNNVHAGTATVILTGTGKFTGTAVLDYTILPAQLENVTIDVTDQQWTGQERDGGIRLSIGNYTLTENEEYTVSYTDNIEPGTATATIAASGTDVAGTVTRTFEILPVDMTKAVISELLAPVYNGLPQTGQFAFAVSDGSGYAYPNLKEGEDYIVTYENNVHAGTATAVFTGKGTHAAGTGRSEFTISPLDLSGEALILPRVTTFVFSGQAKRPKVAFASDALTEGVDYDLVYRDNVNAGTASVTTAAKGNDTTGSRTWTFRILPGGEKVCHLPQGTVLLESEAFAGTAFREIILPDRPVTLTAGCFSGMTEEAIQVTIPNAGSDVDPQALAGPENLTVIAPEGLQIGNMSVDAFCAQNGIWYEKAE